MQRNVKISNIDANFQFPATKCAQQMLWWQFSEENQDHRRV